MNLFVCAIVKLRKIGNFQLQPAPLRSRQPKTGSINRGIYWHEECIPLTDYVISYT